MVRNKKFIWTLYLLAAIIAFWYWHPDEHYQVSEFASYKLGITPIKHLPWEFHNTMRSGILPFFSFLISKFLMVIGCFHPFLTESISRVLTTVLFLVSYHRLIILLSEEYQIFSKRFYYWSMLFWILPIVMIRSSSEAISASLFWLGYVWFRRNLIENNSIKYLGIGLLWGIAFYIRMHIGILVGVAVVYHFLKDKNIKPIVFLILGFILATGIETLINFWLYGRFVFVPIWYFKINLLDGKASSKFGTEPFYYYFLDLTKNLFYPIGIAMLIGVFRFFKVYFKSIFTWFVIVFLLIHSVIEHKEYRFLFPIFPLLVPMAYIGFDSIRNQFVSMFFQIIYYLNFFLLPSCFLIHSFKTYNFLRLYPYTNVNSEIVCDKNDIYSLEEGERNDFEKAYFYKHPSCKVRKENIGYDSEYKLIVLTHELEPKNGSYQLKFQTIPSEIRHYIPESIRKTIDEIYIYEKK